MKKYYTLLLAAALLLAVLSGCGKAAGEQADAAQPTATTAAEAAPSPETTPEPAGIAHGGSGIGTYPADTVVGTVNGEEITWMEYHYWLASYTDYIQQVASQYGFVLDGWEANDLSPTQTNAEIVRTLAQTTIAENHAIRNHLAALGVTASDEDEAELRSIFDQNADGLTGDGDGEATDEERSGFEVYLTSMMDIDRAFFDSLNRDMLLSQKGFEALYGAGGSGVSDEEVLSYANDNGLLSAKHILLLTVDSETHQPLDTDAISEKQALAEQLLAQLDAVKSAPEALEALFDELCAQYTEDTGYASYPDGYIFGEGEMVSSFEDAVKALEIGGLSGIVESEYGYHIILRTALDPDGIIGSDANGNPVSLRYSAASGLYNQQLSAWAEEAAVSWNDGFETPDLEAIFG